MVEERALSSRGILARLVHLFTASGAVAGFMAMLAVFSHEWIEAFLWMMLAVAIDAIDGELARKVNVKKYTPNFDGALMDNLVDYFTYVVVPAAFIYESHLVPDAWALTVVGAMLMTSAYQFCQGEAKTADHFFTGFPSYWNLVVLYLFFAQFNQSINLGILVALAIAVFIPVKYVYPTRTEFFRIPTILLGIVWTAALLVAVLLYPDHPSWLIPVSLLYAVYYLGLSLYLTMRSPKA